MHLRWGLVAQRLVRAFIVVVAKVRRQATIQGRHILVRIEVDVLLFDRAPEPLYIDVVQGPAPTVHRNQDVRRLKSPRKTACGKRNPLVGVEDLRDCLVSQSAGEHEGFSA